MNETEGGKTFVTTQLPVATRDRLKARAEANHRTMSQEIRKLIDESLERQPNGDEVAA